jgi:hypothetical protein
VKNDRAVLCGIDPAMRILKSAFAGEPLSAESAIFSLFGA